MPLTELQSTHYEVSDAAEATEFYYAKGGTDGLPAMPPTHASIHAMLDAAGCEPGDEITFIENRVELPRAGHQYGWVGGVDAGAWANGT